MKGKVWKRIRGSENKNWGKKTSFSNVISPLVTGLVSIHISLYVILDQRGMHEPDNKSVH